MIEIKKYDIADTDLFDRYIRVKKKDSADFDEGSFSMAEIDWQKGIYAVTGLTKGDTTIAIHSYLFIKDMWNEPDAQEWAIKADAVTEMIALKKSTDPMEVFSELISKLAPEEKTYAELKSINGVEIFQTGKWNGDNYSTQDLQDMVDSFPALKDKLQPYVKLGHGEKQELLAKDELPSAGWIENIYMSGNKLLADIVDVPKVIYELIKNKAYKRISSEIYWNLKDSSGEVYKRALKAIALLGGETPAVGSLADVQALYTKRYHEDINGDLKIVDYSMKGDKNMEEENKTLKAKISELEATIEESGKAYSLLEEEKKELKIAAEESEKNFSELQFENRKKDIISKVDSLIDTKKLLPAQKDFAVDALLAEVKSYADLSESPVMKVFEAGAEVVDTEEKTADEPVKAEETKEEEKAEAIEKANSYEEASKIYQKGVSNDA